MNENWQIDGNKPNEPKVSVRDVIALLAVIGLIWLLTYIWSKPGDGSTETRTHPASIIGFSS
jgi:hypothetical protein